MAPAFGRIEANGWLPYFMDTATKACDLLQCLALRTILLTLAFVVRWQTSGVTSSRAARMDNQPPSMSTYGWERLPLTRAPQSQYGLCTE